MGYHLHRLEDFFFHNLVLNILPFCTLCFYPLRKPSLATEPQTARDEMMKHHQGGKGVNAVDQLRAMAGLYNSVEIDMSYRYVFRIAPTS
jgi:hypothetical protein